MLASLEEQLTMWSLQGPQGKTVIGHDEVASNDGNSSGVHFNRRNNGKTVDNVKFAGSAGETRGVPRFDF
jgi:hypothetical protein